MRIASRSLPLFLSLALALSLSFASSRASAEGKLFASPSAKKGRGMGTADIMQFFVDPTLPDQGWIVTANSVQFNGGIKSGGKWAVKFDREVFQKTSGVEAQIGFKILRLQPSRVKRGAVLLLVDNAAEVGQPYQRFVFLSVNGGEDWRLTQKGTVTSRGVATSPAPAPTPAPSAPLTPGGEIDPRASGKLPASGTPTRVRMDAERPGSSTESASATHHPGGVSPLFNLLFDLWLDVRPGVSPLTFDNYHTLILLDLHPTRDVGFSAEVSPTPRYYEISYQATPKLSFRAGRIWIPFDEMNPHEIYGGFYNIDRLREPGAMAFLPEIWTDLGVAMKYRLVNSRESQLDFETYAVNGFGDGGRDPLNQVGTRYPNFEGSTITDNNSDKAFGVRLHGIYNRWLGLGASLYEGRFTSQTDLDRRIWMFGADMQMKFGGTQFKTGYILMNIELPGGKIPSLQRNGFYAELSQRLADHWKLIGRGGSEKDDSRLVTVGDRTLVGGELVYSYSYFQFSLLYYKDLYQIKGKANYEMTGLRLSAMF